MRVLKNPIVSDAAQWIRAHAGKISEAEFESLN